MNIGFIDLHLDEWHANNYPAWIREIPGEHKIAYAWGESDAPTGRSNREWCGEFGVTLCDTLEEVCEKSDAIFILAPSNPEVHLAFAQRVLPYGKPTYMDKTFAPDLPTAREIFRLAKEYGTPLFSTSALRYGEELVKGCTHAMTTGGGRSAEEYIVHQAEMLEVMMGNGAKSVTAHRAANGILFSVAYKDGRQGAMLYGEKMPFALHAEDNTGKAVYKAVKSPYFQTLMAEILRFFETKHPPVSEDSTLEVMALRQAALTAMETLGKEIEL